MYFLATWKRQLRYVPVTISLSSLSSLSWKDSSWYKVLAERCSFFVVVRPTNFDDLFLGLGLKMECFFFEVHNVEFVCGGRSVFCFCFGRHRILYWFVVHNSHYDCREEGTREHTWDMTEDDDDIIDYFLFLCSVNFLLFVNSFFFGEYKKDYIFDVNTKFIINLLWSILNDYVERGWIGM